MVGLVSVCVQRLPLRASGNIALGLNWEGGHTKVLILLCNPMDCQARLSFLSTGVWSNSCPLSQWCHPPISSSVTPFYSCLQCFPASGSFPMSQCCIRCPKYWSFTIIPSSGYLGLIQGRKQAGWCFNASDIHFLFSWKYTDTIILDLPFEYSQSKRITHSAAHTYIFLTLPRNIPESFPFEATLYRTATKRLEMIRSERVFQWLSHSAGSISNFQRSWV